MELKNIKYDLIDKLKSFVIEIEDEERRKRKT